MLHLTEAGSRLPRGATVGHTDRHTVVVGYDGSSAARRALTRAADAAGRGGRVVVVTAVPPTDEHEIAALHRPRDVIREAVALLRTCDVEVWPRVEEAPPAEALAAAAAESGARLIVVGARGHSYLARALRGPVAERLVTRSPCDVLVVR